jgi:hypothetical protein
MCPLRTRKPSEDCRRLRPAILFLGLLLGAAAVTARAAPPAASKEYQVKAAFLLNFTEFIQWPAAAFANPDEPITVGVLGDDPFGAVLEQTFQDESVQGRKLVVKRSSRIEDLKTCQLLFISQSEKDRQADIIASLEDVSTVTVADMDQFAQHGGIIDFYIDRNKIRFEINTDAAQHKGLRISSQLLRRARIVGAGPGKGGS